MLRPTLGGERTVTAHGGTLRDVIRDLDARHPGFSNHLLDAGSGGLKTFVNVYVNDEDVRYLQGLDTRLQEQDVVSILPAVAGGAEGGC